MNNNTRGTKSNITIEQVRKEFEERGFLLLENEYKNVDTKMKYRCLKHPDKDLSVRLSNFRRTKSGCPYCGKRNAKLTFEEVKKIFNNFDYELLESEYKNNATPMKFLCRKHPEVVKQTRVSVLSTGSGACYECRNEKMRGKNNHAWREGVKELTEYLRGSCKTWKNEALTHYENKCLITKVTCNLEVHHVKPFSQVRDEVLKELGYPTYKSVGNYSEEQLLNMRIKLREKHKDILGIPLTKEIHALFHKLYGQTDTTIEDLYEFKARYDSGELLADNSISLSYIF